MLAPTTRTLRHKTLRRSVCSEILIPYTKHPSNLPLSPSPLCYSLGGLLLTRKVRASQRQTSPVTKMLQVWPVCRPAYAPATLLFVFSCHFSLRDISALLRNAGAEFCWPARPSDSFPRNRTRRIKRSLAVDESPCEREHIAPQNGAGRRPMPHSLAPVRVSAAPGAPTP